MKSDLEYKMLEQSRNRSAGTIVSAISLILFITSVVSAVIFAVHILDRIDSVSDEVCTVTETAGSHV